jgi:hypothetical protein
VVYSGSSTNKTDRHDITEILLKVVLSAIKQKNKNCSTGNYENPSNDAKGEDE